MSTQLSSEPAVLSADCQRWLEEQHARHRQHVRTVIWNRLGRTADAASVDDLAAETWARAARGLARFDRRREFAPWLASIAVNVCREWFRQRHRRGRELVEPEELASGHDEDVARRLLELHQAVAGCLAELPPAERELYELMFVQQHSGRAAAQRLGVAEATLRTRHLPRLLRTVAVCLKRKGYDQLDEDLR